MFAIETRRLTKYYGKARGIIDVDLQINEGEIFGFIGPNGAGKSTTIRTLLDFVHPTSGEAYILGKNCFTQSKEIKHEIGYLPSEVSYYEELTARQLLRYSIGFHGKKPGHRIEELAERFELDLDRRFDQLSFGNKKKVAIIQAVLHQPRVLILDEPTSGLDPLIQQRFFELIREENSKGTTVFFSSHVLSDVQRMCQRVGIIKEGRIIRIEEIESLRKKQLKRIKLEFAPGEARPDLKIPGIVETRTLNQGLELLYSGSMNDLIRELAQHNILNLLIEEPSLEEIFMHYYEKEA